MADNEKLRALLAEARETLSLHDGVIECDHPECRLYRFFAKGIDAALAEPVGVHPSSLSDVVTLLENERDAARGVLSALCAEFEGAVAHADWRAAGSPGMSVPFTGDFASATQLPSVVGRMRWWAREMRKVIGEDKP